jgi:formylmethanofuran dehydrogenase subunit E
LLTREAIFRQIDADKVEPIQKFVAVDYDNALQMPFGFHYRGRYYEVTEIIGSFRELPADPSILYLIRTMEGVFALYLDLIEVREKHRRRGQWVLHFRVEDKEDDKMLVDMKLKRVANFHGHLCPDLAIGYQVCQYALLRLELLWSPNYRVIVENAGPAVDAVQHLTGCPLGNGQLIVHDYGKHAYTFVYNEAEGLRLVLKPEAMPVVPGLLTLEEKIKAGRATMLETARYQVLLDERISTLLAYPDQDLFIIQRVAVERPDEPTTSAFVPCSVCGELVAVSHLVPNSEKWLCEPCALQKVAILPEEG